MPPTVGVFQSTVDIALSWIPPIRRIFQMGRGSANVGPTTV